MTGRIWLEASIMPGKGQSLRASSLRARNNHLRRLKRKNRKHTRKLRCLTSRNQRPNTRILRCLISPAHRSTWVTWNLNHTKLTKTGKFSSLMTSSTIFRLWRSFSSSQLASKTSMNLPNRLLTARRRLTWLKATLRKTIWCVATSTWFWLTATCLN